MDSGVLHAEPGAEDWRALAIGLHARYRCADLAEATAIASEIAELAARIGPVPDLDLRPTSITIRIPAHHDRLVDDEDLALAVSIQKRARARGLVGDPGSLRQVQLAVAHGEGVEVRGFWQAVLGYVPDGDEDARDPEDRNPRVWFHDLDGGTAGRGRTHIDVYVPADRVEEIVAAALAAGGRLVSDAHAPRWWTLASPDNHGVDIAAWPDLTTRPH